MASPSSPTLPDAPCAQEPYYACPACLRPWDGMVRGVPGQCQKCGMFADPGILEYIDPQELNCVMSFRRAFEWVARGHAVRRILWDNRECFYFVLGGTMMWAQHASLPPEPIGLGLSGYDLMAEDWQVVPWEKFAAYLAEWCPPTKPEGKSL